MASPFPPRKPAATEVGSFFVGKYYQVLQTQPEQVHQFYSDSSSMIRVDGDSSQSASAILQIHTLLMSLNYSGIEITTINSLDSWNDGVLVMVSGFIKIMDMKRKFVQTFFLAPQENGYFVLNDIFQFSNDEVIYPNRDSVASENIETQLNASNSLAEPSGSDYSLEEDASKYVNSVHIEDDPVDRYSLPEQQQLQHDFETENLVETTPAEEASPSIQSVMHTIHEPPAALVEEPVEEPAKKSYASIVCTSFSKGDVIVADGLDDYVQQEVFLVCLVLEEEEKGGGFKLQGSRGKSVLPAASQPSFRSAPSPSKLNHASHTAVQQSSSASIPVSHSRVETADESFGLDEGEVKSVYVRNLPATVTEAEIEEEFKDFGRIKQDGIFIRVRQEINACYAFVEFEDIVGVQNALQASPIQLAGRQVFIEERRPNSGSTARGGRRGRGRSSYHVDAPRGRFGSRSLGRGSNQEGGDYNRFRGNGYP
ncbi:hypothetical protein L6164_034351 [Bauhinia variegata]|uniref:Uncharacterized protein n=1 Tax=Bauhinia variegata TaxID=167791 RepID=A0ACB9KUR2_BAUVA|nr:hypothetical protein L6164_034351 [Bauhinia variegata]